MPSLIGCSIDDRPHRAPVTSDPARSGWLPSLLALLCLAAGLAPDLAPASAGAEPAAALVTPAVAFSRNLSPRFEANRGQTDPAVKFLARGRGYTIFLTEDEAVVTLRRGTADPAVVRMHLVGARPAPRVTGLAKLPGIVNYFVGADPARWRTGIPTYARVTYESVYPGVDLVYHGTEGQLEYDFVVAPGADPGPITLAFDGADTVSVDGQGDLVLRLKRDELRLRKPIVYQDVQGTRKPLAGTYVVKGGNRVGFEVAGHDPARPLVIDPVLIYSTYLGGTGTDQGRGVAAGPAGTAYVVGSTDAPSFQSPPSASKLGTGGGGDVFVAKFDPSKNGAESLVYLTFIGGRGSDTGRGIAVDGAGNAYLTGQTFSSDFPTTASAFSRKISGKADAFVVKLDAAGTALAYSTFLGGGGPDEGHAIAIACVSAGACNAYVTGATLSSNFPITPFAVFASSQGKQDAFVTKLRLDGSGLDYSTYLGGTGSDAGHGIALECSPPSSTTTACRAWVTGETSSANFSTTVGAFDRTFNGNVDAFVTKFTDGASALIYSSYLGGAGSDRGFGIALDGSGLAYVAGSTDSRSGFAGDAVTKAASTAGPGGGGDAFVAKLDASQPAASQLAYLAYVGGTASDIAYGIAADAAGNVTLTGETSSLDFPTFNALPLALSASTHAFVSRLDATGSALTYSTYLGGSGVDRGFGIAVSGGRTVVTGETSSTDFPTAGTMVPFDASFGGGPTDAFLTILGGTAPVFGPVSNLMFQTGTTVLYPTPTALDVEGDPASVSCTPSSGSTAGASVFPLGDTTVTCTATDQFGGTSSVTFLITVVVTAPPTLNVSIANPTVRQGDPIVLTADLTVSQPTVTITPDCFNTTWTLVRSDGLAVAPRFREKMYGIPNDLTSLAAGSPFRINCDISEVVDPSLLPPGQYRFFATYSNYIQDTDPTPPVFNVWTGSVNSPPAVLTIVGAATRVQVDVKPTSFPSSFNCKNVDRTLDVAVLSGPVFDPANPTADPRPVFDPASIDVSSVRFGKAGTGGAAATDVTLTDLNGDGVPDAVFDFLFGQTGFSCADTSGRNSADVVGILTGTAQGAAISGSDTIHLVGGP